jgi:hypothetical protein
MPCRPSREELARLVGGVVVNPMVDESQDPRVRIGAFKSSRFTYAELHGDRISWSTESGSLGRILATGEGTPQEFLARFRRGKSGLPPLPAGCRR